MIRSAPHVGAGRYGTKQYEKTMQGSENSTISDHQPDFHGVDLAFVGVPDWMVEYGGNVDRPDSDDGRNFQNKGEADEDRGNSFPDNDSIYTAED